MLAVRLPPDIERRLDALAKQSGRSKSYYVRAALADYLGAVGERRVAEPRESYAVTEGSLQLTAVLLPSADGGFVAFNPETGTTSQGEAIDRKSTRLNSSH